MSSTKKTPGKPTGNATEFSGFRKAFWPIHTSELKKFIPLAIIMFCLLFNYTILRDTKDSLIVNSAGAGAITFLKLYCVTPAAILFVVLYAKLTNILSRENVFYAVVAPFVIFFGLFGFVMYPNLDLIHPSQESIQALQAAYPALTGFIDLYAYWAFSLFYVLAEIWGSAMIALMFWQFANYVVRIEESKRFYGLFGVVANLALVISGPTVMFSSEHVKHIVSEGTDPWQITLYILMSCVVVMGLVTMYVYRWMHTEVLTDKFYFDPAQVVEKKKKEKPGLAESFKIIIKSPELGLIALLIMAYGVTINLIEVQWKNQLGVFCAGDKGLFNYYMGILSTVTGLFTIFFGLTIGSNVLRRLSWAKAAMITPLVILLAGTLFFMLILGEDYVAPLLEMFHTHAVHMAVLVGLGIVVVSKAVKYILFDSTKEMAYIPLDDELKTKGKAAVDVIGGRAGKAGGAFVQNMLLIAFATKDVVAIAPVTFGVFAVVGVAWLYAVKVLSVKVNAAAAKRHLGNV